jgi:hypothetical protein
MSLLRRQVHWLMAYRLINDTFHAEMSPLAGRVVDDAASGIWSRHNNSNSSACQDGDIQAVR